MDVRAKIVDKVLENLPELDQKLRDKIERTLLLSLQDYEVQERCTAVEVYDDTNLGLVRKFIATKNWKASPSVPYDGTNRSWSDLSAF